MAEGVIISCVGLGGTIGGDWPVGAYLAGYDPEANNGWGDAAWTADPAHAKVFGSDADAIEAYRAVPANRPTRPDGKPNRPLTIFGVELVSFDERNRPTVADTFRELDRPRAKD